MQQLKQAQKSFMLSETGGPRRACLLTFSTSTIVPAGSTSSSSLQMAEIARMSLALRTSMQNSVRAPLSPRNCGWCSTSRLDVHEENAHKILMSPFL